MIELTTRTFPTAYSDSPEGWDWDFLCKGFIDRILWRSIYESNGCFEHQGNWLYRFKALPALIASYGPILVDGVVCRYPNRLAEHIMEKAYPGRFQVLKSKYDASERHRVAVETWLSLSPRWATASEICDQLGLRPCIGADNAFCPHCDSRSAGDIVHAGGGAHLWHGSAFYNEDDGPYQGLRLSEYELIERAVMAGELKTKPAGLISRLIGKRSL